MNKQIAKDLSDVASEARRKANYLRQRPDDPGLWNYEQKQDGPQVLEEIAQKIENLVAKYFIQLGLTNEAAQQFEAIISHQCRRAINRKKNSCGAMPISVMRTKNNL